VSDVVEIDVVVIVVTVKEVPCQNLNDSDGSQIDHEQMLFVAEPSTKTEAYLALTLQRKFPMRYRIDNIYIHIYIYYIIYILYIILYYIYYIIYYIYIIFILYYIYIYYV